MAGYERRQEDGPQALGHAQTVLSSPSSLDGKMTLTPITLADWLPGYELAGHFRFERLWAGILPKAVTSPRRYNPRPP